MIDEPSKGVDLAHLDETVEPVAAASVSHGVFRILPCTPT